MKPHESQRTHTHGKWKNNLSLCEDQRESCSFTVPLYSPSNARSRACRNSAALRGLCVHRITPPAESAQDIFLNAVARGRKTNRDVYVDRSCVVLSSRCDRLNDIGIPYEGLIRTFISYSNAFDSTNCLERKTNYEPYFFPLPSPPSRNNTHDELMGTRMLSVLRDGRHDFFSHQRIPIAHPLNYRGAQFFSGRIGPRSARAGD